MIENGGKFQALPNKEKMFKWSSKVSNFEEQSTSQSIASSHLLLDLCQLQILTVHCAGTCFISGGNLYDIPVLLLACANYPNVTDFSMIL